MTSPSTGISNMRVSNSSPEKNATLPMWPSSNGCDSSGSMHPAPSPLQYLLQGDPHAHHLCFRMAVGSCWSSGGVVIWAIAWADHATTKCLCKVVTMAPLDRKFRVRSQNYTDPKICHIDTKTS